MSEAYLASFDEPYKKFRYIHNGNASDPLVPGDVVMYELAATADNPGWSVVDATAASVLVAGVVVGETFEGGNIAAGDFGWIQVSGFCDNITTDDSIAAGDFLIAGSAVADAGTLGTNDYAGFGVALAADNDTTHRLSSAIIKGVF